MCVCLFFVQAEDGIRDLVRSRGLGDVYKRQLQHDVLSIEGPDRGLHGFQTFIVLEQDPTFAMVGIPKPCLLYTSDAADERSSVDLGGRRIIKKKKPIEQSCRRRKDDAICSVNKYCKNR